MNIITETLKTESGCFVHIEGIVINFTPNPNNVIPGGIDAPDGWSGEIIHYDNAIRSLIVPDGIKGFGDEFLRGWAITESVVFPDSLLYIGTEDGVGGTFANCFLPEIVLPESLKIIGNFAFGHCYIEKLVVNPANKSKNNRQFKDSTIKKLYLPKKILEGQNTSMESIDYGFYRNFFVHCHCNRIEY